MKPGKYRMPFAFLTCLLIGIILLIGNVRNPLSSWFDLSVYLSIVGLLGFIGFVILTWARRSLLKKIVAGILSLLFVLIFTITLLANIDHRMLLPQVPIRTLTKNDWIQDMDFLSQKLQNHPVYTDSLGSIIENFKDELLNATEINDHQVFITAIKMVRLLNDGHSLVMPLPLYIKRPRYLPLQTHFFSDGIFITNSGKDKSLIGAKIVSINKQPIEKVYKQIDDIIGGDNEWARKFHSGLYLLNMDVLKGLGIVSNTDEAELEIKLGNQSITKKIKSVNSIKWGIWAISKTDDIRPVGWNIRTPKSTIEVKNDTLLWMTFHEVGNEPVLTEIGNKINNQDYGSYINHFVIDLRNNSGGDNYTYNTLIKSLARSTLDITILTSRKTYSAAINFISELQLTGKEFRLIGEPTGAGHNHSGDPETVFLPNSGLMVNISTLSWHFIPDLPEDALQPDVFVNYSSRDFLNNNDPWLEALTE